MKTVLVIDINDELLEDYENFSVDYYLRADIKNDNVNEIIKVVEDCPLKQPPRKLEPTKNDPLVLSMGWNAFRSVLLGEDFVEEYEIKAPDLKEEIWQKD